ncbi:MAG: phage-shock protein [Deltaproteobacteria bacterium]|nr:phage-shock protein [Deltaproteobacteria bacterium]
MNPGNLAVLLIFGPVLIAVIGTFVLLWKWVSTKQGNQLQADEAKTMQELYQGLSRMEERIEALEAILFERQRKEERK